MADLFGSKAKSKGLVIYLSDEDEEKNIYSENLKLWCRKLSDLNTDNFKTGMHGLEKKAEDDYRLGEEMWPPSYAEFRALCFPHNDRDMMSHKILPSVFDPKYAIEDFSRDRVEPVALQELEKMKSLFPDPPKVTVKTPQQIADDERLERLKKR